MASREPTFWPCDSDVADLLSLSFPSRLCPGSLQKADGTAPECVSASAGDPGNYFPILHPLLPSGQDPLGDSYCLLPQQGVTQPQMPVCSGPSPPPGVGQLRMPLAGGGLQGGQREGKGNPHA